MEIPGIAVIRGHELDDERGRDERRGELRHPRRVTLKRGGDRTAETGVEHVSGPDLASGATSGPYRERGRPNVVVNAPGGGRMIRPQRAALPRRPGRSEGLGGATLFGATGCRTVVTTKQEGSDASIRQI